ncbi:hypothetical protein CWE09_02780 [Aliidiomarina minuta]|uniref:D-2-hydroxyglutarate dehydrogenase n=1 Tax=Aliidiomarina minuta TaxID=880057 RepID=A0A432W6M3_9GAMM|nr:FAD-binding and (Fe-S)-binding domain-containing protein [Aliidiomarina minuta]RUO25671.1 hypothetical protein CWE09_02780 [Aliidiomarina minuta]
MSLPALSSTDALQADYQNYLKALAASGFQGDIDASYGGRLIAATDNSIYQQLPQAVLYPRTQEDVGRIMQLAASNEHQSIKFSPRGGGTGTNGQSLTEWLVLDLSRYLNRILEINIDEGWVRVESGLVKDALNKALAPHGYFFAPDTSTSNRATIGGMINTDASGQGSLVYGKTSDHILELGSYLLNGYRLNSAPVALSEARQKAQQDLAESEIYQQLIASCVDKRDAIEAGFPKLNRFLTGYDLLHAYDAEQQQVDISRLIAGSEGTLAVVTEAKLRITPIPRHKVLVNVKYSDFQAALQHAPELVKANATSVETIDSKVLNLAREDIVWHGVKDLLTDEPGQVMDGINMVEITAVDQTRIERKLTRLVNLLDRAVSETGNGVIGYQICHDLPSIGRIYAMRKKAVGLLGATKGTAKPVAFVEDTAVPPEHLADYINEFRALLDSHQLAYGMFGHVDAGVLHVRPALNMQDEKDETLVRTLSDQVMALTAKYGGLMWGEHGKGYRSEYGPQFFGAELFAELRKIKGVFDPDNRLNPGKICTPRTSTESLVSVDGAKRGWFDKQIPLAAQQSYQSAMDCNGNGLCFNFDVNTPMCPSFRATQDRRYSPKGRASMIREWLRQTASAGYDVNAQIKKDNLFKRWKQSRRNADDFSHEVKKSMDHCLACKACSSQCPVKVDIPSHRARFLAHYHSRYIRPLRDHAVKNVENALPYLARMPRLANVLMHNPLSRYLTAKLLRFQDMPRLSVPALCKRTAYQKALTWDDFIKQQQGMALDDNEASQYVALVEDSFTSFYEADLVEDFLLLCEKLQVKVIILPFQPNGKAAHVKGFLSEFHELAKKQAALLNQVASYKVPLVGLDASTALCYRDEYLQALGNSRGAFQVLMLHEWLAPLLKDKTLLVSSADTAFSLLPHCTEQTADAQTSQTWSDIFALMGIKIRTPTVGCCGMAGTYGHETEQAENSLNLFNMSWKPELNKAGQALATGFSCRCQSQRFAKQSLKHPLQVVLQRLN